MNRTLFPEILDSLGRRPIRRRDARLLIGTDVHIPHERRVALTPRHVRELHEALLKLGLEPHIAVVAGAGEQASGDGAHGFSDEAYLAAGAQVVTEDDFAAGGTSSWDVVHALKEPTPYEATIPGPFLRIGALHLASRPAGVRDLLSRRNFAGILDGGTVGNCSWRLHGGDRTPIVASMSRFAGSVAGRQLVRGLDEASLRGRVVVVGGGVAGWAAIREVIGSAEPLVVVEPWAPARERLRNRLDELPGDSRDTRIVEALTDELFDDAVGILFAHRSGARAAEKVCTVDQIRRMRPGSAVVDIAIDQGGAIAHPGYDEHDDAHAARDKYRALLDGHFYYAETNMPREEPREASEMHGDSSLPYLLVLLGLVAHHGSSTETVRALLTRPQRTYGSSSTLDETELLSCLEQDLRNGLQLALVDGELEITDRDVAADESLSEWVRSATVRVSA